MQAERTRRRFVAAACFALVVLGGTGVRSAVLQSNKVSSESSVSLASAATPGPGEFDPTVAAGQQLFGQVGCNGCHTIDGVGGIVGPNLSAVGVRPSRDVAQWSTTEAYIRASIEGPGQYVVEGYTPDMVPPDQLGIDAADIDQLLAYLLTLKGEE